MNIPLNCPKCAHSMVGEPIPEDRQEAYGGRRYFSRLISIYDRDKDRHDRWRCPDCKHEWSASMGGEG